MLIEDAAAPFGSIATHYSRMRKQHRPYILSGAPIASVLERRVSSRSQAATIRSAASGEEGAMHRLSMHSGCIRKANESRQTLMSGFSQGMLYASEGFCFAIRGCWHED